jgi:hypothetical protein
MRKCLRNTNVGSRAALATAVLLGSPAAGASPIAAGVLAHYIAVQSLTTNRPVTSCADDGSANTLRAVVATAASGDTIDLSPLPGADPTCTTSTITLGQGEIAIPVNLTLSGPTNTGLAIVAGGNFRVLDSTSTDAPNAYLRISSLKIASNGTYHSNHLGGCIYAKGAVYLDRATVADCVAYGAGSSGKYIGNTQGGGIFAHDVVMANGSVVSGNTISASSIGTIKYGAGVASVNFTCTDSTVSGNIAVGGSGGGVAAQGNVSLTRCTLSGNGASGSGGALIALGGSGKQVSIDESTISGNLAGKGGGIYAKSPVSLASSTIAFNTAQQANGGGIHSIYNVAMTSTIVAPNRNDSGANADIFLASGRTLTGSGNLVISVSVNPPGVIVSASDPLLAPLGNHGGLTRTHALLAGSPAIDSGKNGKMFATDQRGTGFAREVPTGMPDIGAYERQLIDDEIFGNGFE